MGQVELSNEFLPVYGKKKVPLVSRAFWVLELQIMEYAAWL